MHFANPMALFLLIAIPLLGLLYIYVTGSNNKLMAVWGEAPLMRRLSNISPRLRLVRFLLLCGALTFCVIALARPQFGTRLVEVTQSASDIVICVDVSTSMLAQDVKPSRLEKAKILLSQLVQQLGGNRIGIIAYAGTAFWQCPLTLDTSGAILFLQIMDANLIPMPGTSIGSAVNLAIKGLEKTAPRSKAIVLLTDGEDHHSDPEGAAAIAASQGIKIYTIGFGNPQGEPIPLSDEAGKFAGYKKDKKGAVVMSKMDESLLIKMASATGGEYFRAIDGNIDNSRLLSDLGALERSKRSSRMNREYEDRYQYFLFLGLLFLLAEFLIPETKRQEML
jgi:Ca-activated chloride channel family protein